MHLNTAHFQAHSHRIVMLPSPKLPLLNFFLSLFSIMSWYCDQWKIWLGRWDICRGKAIHKWFSAASSAIVWARKKLWGLVINTHEIAQFPELEQLAAVLWLWRRWLPGDGIGNCLHQQRQRRNFLGPRQNNLYCLAQNFQQCQYTLERGYYKGKYFPSVQCRYVILEQNWCQESETFSSLSSFVFQPLPVCLFLFFLVLIYRAKSLWCWAVRLSESINSLYVNIYILRQLECLLSRR